MLRTLRNRLILSHIIPLLLIIPMMGIGLIYVLESQVYLPALSGQLEDNARLVAQVAALQESSLQNSPLAQALADRQAPGGKSQIMLLNERGVLLASSSVADQARIGQVFTGIDVQALRSVQNGQVISKIQYSQRQDAEVIEVYTPVIAPDRSLRGYVRMSYNFATLADELFQLRVLILSLLAVSLVIGSGIGYLLAVSVANPIGEVTSAISALAHSSQMKLLNVYGPEEVQSLSQSVNDLVTRLRELEQARRQLLANLVHEIGRPLGALRSAIAALAQGAEKDQVLYHDLLNGMDGETRRLQRLLNDLSELHDQVLGTLELHREPIDLKKWLPDTLRTWQAAAQEKGVRWELTSAEDLPVISGDPNRLAQVLGNLVSNAIKFTPPGGTVSVSASTLPGKVGVTIRDTGPGMTAAEQEQIFQPFYRGTQGRRFPQGMGLGLSIARDLTKAHGGQIVLESTPGSGSKFTLWLPVEPHSL